MLSCSTVYKNTGQMVAGRNVAALESPTNCSDSVSPFIAAQNDLTDAEKEILSKLMQEMRSLMGENIYGVPKNTAFNMDKVFVAELRKKIKTLNQSQLNELENIMSRSVKGLFPKYTTGGSTYDIEDVKKMYIRMNFHFVDHPSSRIILWHELDHVIDAILKKRFSTKSFETSAFSAQYDYTRKIFAIDDLEGLKKEFTTDIPAELVERLKNVGVIFMKENVYNINLVRFAELSQEKDVIKDYYDFINRTTLNPFFIYMLENALTMNKPDFIKSSLEPYRVTILKERVMKILKFGSVPVAAYFIYKTLFEDNE